MLSIAYSRWSRCATISIAHLASPDLLVSKEAARFMRHAKRTTLTTSDIDQALRVLNIEPLYGHFPYNPPSFRRALPFPQMQSAGSVYFVEDEEIEFDRVLREEKITLPKGVSWTAHWLAVEGVQPLIPENPPAVPKEDPEGKPAAATVLPGELPAPSVFVLAPPQPRHQAGSRRNNNHSSSSRPCHGSSTSTMLASPHHSTPKRPTSQNAPPPLQVCATTPACRLCCRTSRSGSARVSSARSRQGHRQRTTARCSKCSSTSSMRYWTTRP